MNQSNASCRHYLVRAAVAAVLGTATTAALVPAAHAAEQAPAPAAGSQTEELDEVQVTGSRIVRRDLQSNSPLVTIDRQQLEDSTFVSVEEALNDLPQFMVGGAAMGGNVVTSLQGANGLDGGRGTGDMFNMSLLPDNAGAIGVVVPGAANVNLRGLGANRALVLIDGHRAMPVNASMTVDLNTIPTNAIGGMEVITGGASAVYGADALAGVTNIQFRDNFEGFNLQFKGGVNEVGDGGEYQISGLMGTKMADGRGHALIGIEYTKRNVSYWKSRDFFREVMESPYSSAGDYAFAWEPGYTSGGGTGTFNVLQRAWSGNAPSTAAILSVFSDRNCYDGATQLNCVADGANAPRGGGWYFNPDGTIYTRTSQTGTGASAVYYGPQGYDLSALATRQEPSEITCTFTSQGVSRYAAFDGAPCTPTANRVDWGRWLSSPREAYNVFGRARFEFNDGLEAFSNFMFSSSNTETRREPAPFSGGFGVVIPFYTSQGGGATYLPSIITNPGPGQVYGQTRAEYLAGGPIGTSCAPMGGCTMAQAFPVSSELRTLLESRATSNIGTTGVNANNAFRGLSACNVYTLANSTTPGALLNTASGQYYTVQIDPNTGRPVARCGANSGWQLNQQLSYMPPRGTVNTGRLYQLAAGLRGDLHLSDWTWELYSSYGNSEAQTQYVGFTSLNTYQRILSAPNYGQGYRETGLSSKFLTCTSGLNPFDFDLVVSQDCIDALQSNQIDRNSMTQRIHEFSAQGHVADLPAGEVRGAVGATYRKNDYQYTPDSLRERDYITDTSAGQFGAGSIDEAVTAKEVYGELLIPVLRDLPFVHRFELELGARHSTYSTGQKVETYKVLGSWEPVEWVRLRGGYNRAERAPNMSELFATPSASAQFAAAPLDPCRNDTTTLGPGGVLGNANINNSANPNRAQLQALCAEHMDAWGANGNSEFQAPGAADNWNVAGGAALVVGNPNLRNERGDTWTVGLALASPFSHPLLNRANMTLDWYEARVTDPIEVQQTRQIVDSCYNVNGLNTGYDLDDPLGFCSLIERDPVTGGIVRVYNEFGNQGKLVIRGVDLNVNWSATMEAMGLSGVPGSLSVAINGNYLIDQIQRYGTSLTDDYAGYGGASRIRTNTGVSYHWGNGNRVSLQWQYRLGTHVPTTFATTLSADGQNSPALIRSANFAGYGTTNLFSATAGTRIGGMNASLSINNLLNTKPKPGGYDLRDPNNGFGSFSPFDDLVGRRYSINLSMDF